jgi:polar amino acid transport system permease protein
MTDRSTARATAAIAWTKFALFALLVVGGIAYGAAQMNYAWKWHQVPRFVVRVIDGALYPGPLLKGLMVTLEISAVSFLLALAIGLATALCRLSDSVVARFLSRCYLELVRNTPLLVQIYLLYFVLAPILNFDRWFAAVFALAVFEGAFAAEIFRGGIMAVRKGQWEAAWTLGLSRADAYRHVVLPQALRVILPPLAGLGVSLIKHSAIVSVIAVFDLTNEGRNIISDTFMTFEIWLTVAALYLCVTVLLSLGVGLLERRLKGAMA